ANNNMAIELRETILTLPNSQLSADQYLQFIEVLDEYALDDFARVSELLGLATGPHNAWSTLRIGELKAMLALAAGDLQQALLWIEWTLEFNRSTFDVKRVTAYHCLHTLVKMLIYKCHEHFSDYYPALCKMYGQERLDTLWSVVCGQQRFYGLFAVDEDLTQFTVHQALLQVYQQLQQAKTAK